MYGIVGRADDVRLFFGPREHGYYVEKREEFEGFVLHDPQGCFIIEADGRPVGLCVAVAHGEVGFRKAEPAVALAEGIDEAAVCRLLRKARLGRLVRVKQRPDRASIRKALAEGDVDAARLRRCGVELMDLPDHFRCRLGRRETRLSQRVGGTAR